MDKPFPPFLKKGKEKDKKSASPSKPMAKFAKNMKKKEKCKSG